MTNKTYKIVRSYMGAIRSITIKTGLTLEEAQAHCRDLETSSSTCTEERNIQHTEAFGPWFDGYVQYPEDD